MMLSNFFPEPTPAKQPLDSNDDMRAMLYRRNTPTNPQPRRHPELQKFLFSTSDLMSREFWEAYKKDLPGLYAIYNLCCAIQPTNASVERLFSLAKLIYDDLAGNMDPETIFFQLAVHKESKAT